MARGASRPCSPRADDSPLPGVLMLRLLHPARTHARAQSGTVLLEKETDWGAALAKFLRAKAAFEQLEKARGPTERLVLSFCPPAPAVARPGDDQPPRLRPPAQVGSLEQSAVCRQRLGELEPSLRYCSYKGGSASAADLSSAFASGAGAGAAGYDLLKDKLDAVAAEARLKVAAEVSSIPWRGLSLPVRSESTRVLLISAGELAQQIEAAEVTGAASAERQMASFDKLLLALTDARRQVRGDLGTAAGEGPIAELRALDFAVTCMSLARTIQRNRLLLTTLRARWARQQQEEADAAGAGAGGKGGRGGKGVKGGKAAKAADKAEEKPVRLQELVRLFDTLLGNVSELAEVAGEAARASSPAAEEAGRVAAECSAEEAVVRAERCALLARAQLLERKYAEAATLFGRSAELAQRAAASLAASPSGAGAAAKGKQPQGAAQGAGAERERLLALAQEVGTAARRDRCVAIVKGVSADSASRKARGPPSAPSLNGVSGGRASHLLFPGTARRLTLLGAFSLLPPTPKQAATSSLEKMSLDDAAQPQAPAQPLSDSYALGARACRPSPRAPRASTARRRAPPFRSLR